MCWLTAGFVAAAVLLGFIDAWSLRYDVGSDALSYLEIGDALRRGDWHQALSTHWSPLYSVILAAGLALAEPTPRLESTIIHLITFGIFLATVAAYWFFVRQLLRIAREARSAALGQGLEVLSQLCLAGFAWVLFLWSSLRLIRVGLLSPDMCVAAVVYVASALLLRIRGGRDSWLTFVVLGLVLALGYFAKTAMLPMGFVFLGCAALMMWHRRGVAKAGLAVGLFLLLSAPLVIALSVRLGRPTIGTTGLWNYARFANGIGRPVHWQGRPVGSGIPKHPTRQLMTAPAVYEFAQPVPGTYPPWRDPMYWYEGVSGQFNWKGTVRTIGNSLRLYAHLIGGVPAANLPVLDQSFALALVVMLYTGGRWRGTARGVAELWPVLIPPVAALVMYSLVYSEARYIAAYVVVLLAGCLVGLRLPAGRPEMQRLAQAFLAIVVAIWAASAAYLWQPGLRTLMNAGFGRDDGERHLDWEAATALGAKGLSGSPMGYIGRSYGFYWARLAHGRIVAEIRDLSPAHSRYADWVNVARIGRAEQVDDVELFWTRDRAVQERAYAAFRGAGARLVVADAPRLDRLPAEWEKLGQSGMVVHRLDPAPHANPGAGE